MGKNCNIKSIHVDESGDFSLGNDLANILVVSLTFVPDAPAIETQLQHYENDLRDIGFSGQVHTALLVRMEKDFKNLSLNIRRKIFWSTYKFSRSSGCTVYSFVFDKNLITDQVELRALVQKTLVTFLDAQLAFQSGYSVYYDGGQRRLADILNAYFRDKPVDNYLASFDKDKDRFYQVADLDTYIYALAYKIEHGIALTKSDQFFFSEDDLQLLVKYTHRWEYKKKLPTSGRQFLI